MAAEFPGGYQGKILRSLFKKYLCREKEEKFYRKYWWFGFIAYFYPMN